MIAGTVMTSPDVTALYGVDGTKRGWAVARSSPDLRDVELCIEPDLEGLFSHVNDCSALLAIDIPIGLPESGPRECDRAARRMLRRPRGSSVFPAPMRAALESSSYLDACRLNEAACGKRLSRQSHAILPRIRDVDILMTPERQARIREAHPEISFMLMSGRGNGLLTNKKKARGRAERFALLQCWFPNLDLDGLLSGISRAEAPRDDLLDALACLVTAWRIANGKEICLPAGESHYDARGLRMEIVA